METIKLTDDQIEFIERGCSEVWPIERQFLRWSLKRNIRHGTALVSRGVEADGVESVAHLIVTGPWILLAAIFGLLGTSIFEFYQGTPNRILGYLCVFIFALTFLIGVTRLIVAIRSKARFHLGIH